MFEPNIALMIWTTATFLVVLGILSKVAYKPINDILVKRQEMIRSTIKEAEHTQEEATKLLNEYKTQLEVARKEAEEIIERGRKVGETTKQEIMVAAKSEAENTMRRAEEAMTRERKEMVEELKKEVANMTIMAAERVVRKSITPEDHARLIEEAIKEVKEVS